MATGRMLKKNISNSRRLAALKSDRTRLLYTWMLPHLDVEGRFSANPLVIRGNVVPRLKHIGLKTIQTCLEDMAKQDLIIIYEADGDKYLQYRKFKDFQILRDGREMKSQIPAPPLELRRNSVATDRQGKLSKEKIIELNKSKDIFKNNHSFPR